MKPTLLLLSLLSASAFASPSTDSSVSSLDTLQKNLSNPELYQQHHIQIVKEEKHHFLFFPYTKQVLVNDVKLVGPDVMMANQTETRYVQSVSKNENNEIVIQPDTIKTGLFINVKTLENSNKQTISVSNSELVSLENFTTNITDNAVNDTKSGNEQSNTENENENVTIQLPTVKETYFSEPIHKNHFEKTWKDSSGTQYKLIYTGEKNVVKS